MNKPTGTISQEVTVQSLIAQTLQSPWQSPRLWRNILGIFIALFSAVILDIPANPVFATAPCTVMRRGDRGESVKALQQTLINNGYNLGTADGIFGEMTEIIVISFQRQNNLDPDGVVGPSTCTALLKLKNNELTPFVAASTNTATPRPAPAPAPKPAPAPTPKPSPAPTAAEPRVLKKGDTGEDVVTLQNALKARGFTSVVVNGTFDQATEDAVKRLQNLEQIPQTGVMDKLTRDRLSAYLNAQLINAGNQPSAPAPSTPAPAIPPANPALPAPLPAPTLPNDGVIYSPPNQPAAATPNYSGMYVVAIPVRNGTTLGQVQRIVPQAMLDRSRQGSFVNAGAYRNRYDAESVSNSLKAKGLDARVFVP